MRPILLVVNKNFIIITLVVLLISGALGFWYGNRTVRTMSRIAEAVSGRLILIDAGHGLPDPGAVGRNGAKEAEIVLSISKNLEQLLNRAGVYTKTTRQNDNDLVDGDVGNLLVRKRYDLSKRVAMANDTDPDLVVSIHANSFPEPIWSGAQTFYSAKSEEAQLLAVAIQDCMVEDLGPNSRTAKSATYYLLDRVTAPTALVEVGFLSNPREESLLKQAEYQQRVAKAIYRGIVNYLIGKYARENATLAHYIDNDKIYDESETPDMPVNTIAAPSGISGAPNINSSEKTLDCELFFMGSSNYQDGLVTELRTIDISSDKLSEEFLAKLLMDELVKGPGDKSVLFRVLPYGSKYNDIRVTGNTVYVDLDGAFTDRFWGGSRAEELTVASIVNTLISIDNIDSVKISVDGRSDISITGHMMLDKPFDRFNQAVFGAQK